MTGWAGLVLFALAASGVILVVSLAGGGLTVVCFRAFVALGSALVTTTELLNASAGVTAGSLSLAWGLLSAACLTGLFFSRGRLKNIWQSENLRLPLFSSGWRWIAGFWALWFGVLLVLAVIAAPNNYDSLVYRLPRVMQWAGAGSVDFFPTQILRQNTRPPLAEWVLLQQYLVLGSDRFFALVQWLAFVLTAVGAVETARMLGADRRQKLLAFILVATTPMAILQATSTQNDLVASALLFAFLIFGWRMAVATETKLRILEAGFCGGALGLLILTKTTVLPVAAIFGVGFGVVALYRSGFRALGPGMLCLLVAVSLAAGHATRNFRLSGSILGPEGETIARTDVVDAPEVFGEVHTNAVMSPRHLVSNGSRNLAVLLSGPLSGWNDFLVWTVWKLHGPLGLSVEDPAITLPGQKFELSVLRHEDVSGNLPQVLLALFALVLLVGGLVFQRRPSWRVLLYAGGLVLSFLALSAVLRWEIWHARIFLPLVLAACPLTAVVFPLERWGAFFAVLCGALGTYALSFVLENDRRPIFGQKSVFSIPRGPQFVRGDFEAYSPFHQAVRAIKRGGYPAVGLHTDVNDITYPLWPLLKEIGRGNVTLRQVDPRNLSRQIGDVTNFDAVLATHRSMADDLMVNGTNYVEVWREGNLTLFERKP